MIEKIIAEIVECKAAGHLAKRLLISTEDLINLQVENPAFYKEHIEDTGSFYGLEVVLVGKGCPFYVLP